MQLKAASWLAAGTALVAAGCTFLVHFDETADTDAGLSGDDGSSDDDRGGGPVDGGGGAETAPPDADVCMGQPEGFNYAPADPLARCCGGKPVHIDGDDNCGGCGHGCNLDAGQKCRTQNGHWMCRGCANGGDCWSGCCSTTYMPFSCTPNMPCNVGTCNDALCGPNSKCITEAGGSNYCTYDF